LKVAAVCNQQTTDRVGQYKVVATLYAFEPPARYKNVPHPSHILYAWMRFHSMNVTEKNENIEISKLNF
jgi:hypothetical protein